MNKLYIFIIILSLKISPAISQTNSCTQVLRNLRTLYEQGHLYELKNSVSGCLDGISTKNNSEFSKEEKQEAYKYLTLASIFLNQPKQADEMMLKLLKSDHFYKPNYLIDPSEFTALYNKFRRDPLFRVGVKFGPNITLPFATTTYTVGGKGSGQGKYSLALSFHSFLVLEKNLTKKFVLSLETGYTRRVYNYDNQYLSTPYFPKITKVKPNNLTFKEIQNCIDFNVFIQYNLVNSQKKVLFVGIGPGATYLLNSSNQPQTTLYGLKQTYVITGASADDTKAFRSFNYSASAMAGVKIRLGEVFLTLDARYQFGLTNVVNPSQRTNQELAFDYHIVPNDYLTNNFVLNVGVLYSYFNPKKLIK